MENHWNQPTYPTIDVNTMQRHDDFISEFKSMNVQSGNMSNSMSNSTHSTSNSLVPMNSTDRSFEMDNDTLQQLKVGFAKMMATLERLEQRIQRVEQTTSLILKNQQEVFQVPFMSQTEIDQARQAAEQLERDSSVAKQLQAAYNKEVEVKKNLVHVQNNSMALYECPICGVRVNAMDLEVHVDNCLEMFSNDPKKEAQVQDVKKKMDQGFFSRFMKTSKKTETTTKVTTTSTSSARDPQSATAPLLGDQEGMMNGQQGYFNPGFAYPPFASPHMSPNQTHPPMMMPMYMYPSYPATHMTTSLQE